MSACDLASTLSDRVEAHITDISEDMILAEIEDIKEEFLDGEWESDFDDVYDAYAEQGRGEAESQILQEHAVDVLGSNATTSEVASFMEEMAYQLGLSLN